VYVFQRIYTRFACTMASNESLPSRVKEFHRVRFLWPAAHVHASTSVYPYVEVNARAVRHFSCDVYIRMLTGFTSIHCSQLASYEICNYERIGDVVNYTDNVFYITIPYCLCQSIIIDPLLLLRKLKWIKIKLYNYVNK